MQLLESLLVGGNLVSLWLVLHIKPQLYDVNPRATIPSPISDSFVNIITFTFRLLYVANIQLCKSFCFLFPLLYNILNIHYLTPILIFQFWVLELYIYCWTIFHYHMPLVYHVLLRAVLMQVLCKYLSAMATLSLHSDSVLYIGTMTTILHFVVFCFSKSAYSYTTSTALLSFSYCNSTAVHGCCYIYW